jgi:hypothetical protein
MACEIDETSRALRTLVCMPPRAQSITFSLHSLLDGWLLRAVGL